MCLFFSFFLFLLLLLWCDSMYIALGFVLWFCFLFLLLFPLLLVALVVMMLVVVVIVAFTAYYLLLLSLLLLLLILFSVYCHFWEMAAHFPADFPAGRGGPKRDLRALRLAGHVRNTWCLLKLSFGEKKTENGKTTSVFVAKRCFFWLFYIWYLSSFLLMMFICLRLVLLMSFKVLLFFFLAYGMFVVCF